MPRQVSTQQYSPKRERGEAESSLSFVLDIPDWALGSLRCSPILSGVFPLLIWPLCLLVCKKKRLVGINTFAEMKGNCSQGKCVQIDCIFNFRIWTVPKSMGILIHLGLLMSCCSLFIIHANQKIQCQYQLQQHSDDLLLLGRFYALPCAECHGNCCSKVEGKSSGSSA